jgi:hypothetical protein
MKDLIERLRHNPTMDLFAEAADALEQQAAVIEQMLSGIKVLSQAMLEIHHARTNPTWFSKGQHAADQHLFMWIERGRKAAEEALALQPDLSALREPKTESLYRIPETLE